MVNYWFASQFPEDWREEGLWVRPQYLDTKKEMNRGDKVAIYESSFHQGKKGESAVVALARVEDIKEPPEPEGEGKDKWLKIASLDCKPANCVCPLKETLLILKPRKKVEIASASNLGSYIRGYGGRMTKIQAEQFQQFRAYCRVNI